MIAHGWGGMVGTRLRGVLWVMLRNGDHSVVVKRSELRICVFGRVREKVLVYGGLRVGWIGGDGLDDGEYICYIFLFNVEKTA